MSCLDESCRRQYAIEELCSMLYVGKEETVVSSVCVDVGCSMLIGRMALCTLYGVYGIYSLYANQILLLAISKQAENGFWTIFMWPRKSTYMCMHVVLNDVQLLFYCSIGTLLVGSRIPFFVCSVRKNRPDRENICRLLVTGLYIFCVEK